MTELHPGRRDEGCLPHPWSKTPTTGCVLPGPAFTDSSHATIETMESRDCWHTVDHPDTSPHPQHLGIQLDFFRKLGYSTAQVDAVYKKFGLNTDTDKVLGELVKLRAGLEAKQGPVATVPGLVGDLQAADTTLLLPATSGSREESSEDEDALRPVVIDGSNVAMSHGNKEVFSCLGIQLAVNFFLDRGHTEITVFVPSWRKEQPRPDVPITDQQILRDLEKRRLLVFTPSRRVAGKRVVCNDDCFIVQLAYESGGVIVSNDIYRDLQGEKPEWKRFIEASLLMYSFVNDKFMPPDDPLGRHGPTLDNFLRRFPKTQRKQPCPYGKKCTYGIKCKFHHPERANQSNRSLADVLRENASSQKESSSRSSPVLGQSLLLVEEMAKKLTLGHEVGSSKKDKKHESVGQVKANHCSRKRATCGKEKTNLRPPSERGFVSQEQLDSGLGSIDSQQLKVPLSNGDQNMPASVSYHPTLNLQQKYFPPSSTPCSCCSHGPPSQRTTPGYFHHSQHHSIRPVCSQSCDMICYDPHHHTSYSAYHVSVPAYSPLANFQHSRLHNHYQQPFCSDPFPLRPPDVHSLPGERSPWETRQGSQSNLSMEEREVVRKKLLAIFSAHLVDTAMDMFPQVMDPQTLAAEILMLQSHNRMR
ncbi:endoribonuclease ZC3H12A [Aulostomus maculatus]